VTGQDPIPMHGWILGITKEIFPCRWTGLHVNPLAGENERPVARHFSCREIEVVVLVHFGIRLFPPVTAYSHPVASADASKHRRPLLQVFYILKCPRPNKINSRCTIGRDIRRTSPSDTTPLILL